MELSVGLSPCVRTALPGLVERIVQEARELGFDFRSKNAHDAQCTEWPAPNGVDVAGLHL
jgi:hypothetical protein